MHTFVYSEAVVSKSDPNGHDDGRAQIVFLNKRLENDVHLRHLF